MIIRLLIFMQIYFFTNTATHIQYSILDIYNIDADNI